MTSTPTRAGAPATRPGPPSDPLAPVRAALLARARADAAAVLAEADAEAASVLADARREADAVLAAARAQGAEDAEALLAAERTRARRRARTAVLAAQRAAYDELTTRVRAAVLALRDEPAYESWRDRMRAEAGRLLGAGARIREHPDGGVLAETDTRRAAYTLAGLAGRVLDALGPELEELWRP